MAEKSVLLVEDEDNIAMALGYLIRKLGYELRRVADGNDALAAIEERAPDLVVLDVMLPGRSGFEVCQIVRRDPALASMKILMITARGGAVEKRKGFAMGADGFLTKPFSNADLSDQIVLLMGDKADG
ncbi:response regulator receiver protein [Actibacterium atlanticum]|uniref:Response regulator receiver protein n=1 Tax=Actibacterium atlanticum TaxID=1461693 RepID=A0A058ZII2_9RHOB|nr:response regulator [Actibacterium atlanticum]KCV81002.1 response regulator receiver protein [Actibacterium atlanticum]